MTAVSQPAIYVASLAAIEKLRAEEGDVRFPCPHSRTPPSHRQLQADRISAHIDTSHAQSILYQLLKSSTGKPSSVTFQQPITVLASCSAKHDG